MKCVIQTEPRISELRIRLESNNLTDVMPMPVSLIFRRQTIRVNTQAFALACATILADHCGDLLEIPHLSVAPDYIDAIRMIMNANVNVAPFNGEAKILATDDMEILCHRAGHALQKGSFEPLTAEIPVISVDWFSDFVDPATRNSTHSRIGDYFTNAALVTAPEFVSLAVALLHGGDSVCRISVPLENGGLTPKHHRFRKALETVAITLDWIPATSSTPPTAPRISAQRRRPKA